MDEQLELEAAIQQEMAGVAATSSRACTAFLEKRRAALHRAVSGPPTAGRLRVHILPTPVARRQSPAGVAVRGWRASRLPPWPGSSRPPRPRSAGLRSSPESGGSPNADEIRTLYIMICADRARASSSGVEGVLLYSLFKFRARKGARGGADPRQHAARDRLDGRRRGDPRLRSPSSPSSSSPRSRTRRPRDRRRRQPGRRQRRCCRRDRPAQPPPNGKALNIKVDGQQYVWRYIYPGQRTDGLGASTPTSDMVVPVGMTVTLDIASDDVVHSWWIPQLGGKMDAVPGYTNKTWFKIDQGRACLQRPVRRAVRPQPREHGRARDGRAAGAVRRVAGLPEEAAQRSQRAGEGGTRQAERPDGRRHRSRTPRTRGIKRTMATTTLAPVPQIIAHRVERPRARLDVVDHDDRPQEDRDHVPGHDVRLLRARRRRGAADAHPARRAGQHAADARDATTSSSRCTGRR